ncbi:MAG TPA: UDP-N-acetylmuramoyl-L-alanyl-D-glutamate--2,6-diaminopimelate ligase [Persephonella sp.]|uniref:UDP-N-acetylmuramoyl-L-alanyl-D-glutamate--2,6-diaminopimelate ligase n=1 Tax=Persephonella marina (strain DSM 14350 / EX-H1) TaxID=123214 RepID=C0QSJ7_PERMH|nr:MULTISPECIES: UDP-N-acetylmuramoyl-L-alanyl-D-glutamate--2,6-diaminopimelate ligase [Persephonella]ACO02989.1 UDP-N-acetylmuramoyl-L-alanyl-D-glutamate--2,6-diaminopimelate ligase (UDP-MurNAc-L-Ala-D-Glu:meso-diaminopimelate ligase)(Meso-diaminopimelate-adding enzyme) (Meso-A2pm-adding enzyme) (UDP-N-acetylmuramyl-tripeptide synthetase) (UDP-MurNAc-tripeptidesynt [Persephonella marina EX-H1]HCB69389.1 UDP-N-acetylmuramoyl-L-alanyl-D-glutamate--2,6-diaminopimelate ligase [Persephonella sp.]
MKRIDDLFEDIFHRGSSEKVSHLTNNSKKVKKGSVFFAIKGTKIDGHQFIEDAIRNGASAVVLSDRKKAEYYSKKYPDVTFVISDNIRKTQAEVSNRFYDHPSEKLKVIGVTGTNGKTTVTNLLLQYLELAGKNTGIIGTIHYKYREKIFASGRTTPDSIEWFYLLSEMRDRGADYVVAEVSSHAVDQYRVYGTVFHGGIFTNLTQDHLDYHRDMENYFQTKKSFFDYIKMTNPEGVISTNIDDHYGRRIYQDFKSCMNTISYGRDKNAQFRVSDFVVDMKGVSFCYEYNGIKRRVKSDLKGEFNIYNIAAAFSYLLRSGFDIDFLHHATEKLKPIRGRFETVEKDFLVVNDYAHTPDAIEKILMSLNQIKKNRIIIVFGAGGDRDRGKRPLMGKIAEELADIIILTSDNPRSEDPSRIIEDIKSGMKMEKEIYEIIDREEAIKKAIEIARKDDIVLIAGKGHETYQIIGDKTYYFDDLDVAKKYLGFRDG